MRSPPAPGDCGKPRLPGPRRRPRVDAPARDRPRYAALNKQIPERRPAGNESVVNRLARHPARIPSRVVLGGGREVVIVHGGNEYTLRVDSAGELVLSR